MTTCIVDIVGPEGYIPTYQTEGSVGADLKAFITEPFAVPPLHTVPISTGIRVAIPKGWEGQVRSRSGLSLNGLVVANSPGTIDPDYRGEVKVLIRNVNPKEYIVIHPGDRIAQLVVAPVSRALFKRVDTLDETPRGEAGFGSTGVEG